MELIAKLGVDLKLLLAQIINFLILAFILHRFAYKPVLEMLEKRQKKIEQGMKDSEKSEQLLKEIEETREAALRKMKEESLVFLEKAAKEAEAVKQDMLKKAAEDVRALHQKAEVALVQEREKMLREVGKEVVEIALLATERILSREFSSTDQQRIVSELVSQAKQKH